MECRDTTVAQVPRVVPNTMSPSPTLDSCSICPLSLYPLPSCLCLLCPSLVFTAPFSPPTLHVVPLALSVSPLITEKLPRERITEGRPSNRLEVCTGNRTPNFLWNPREAQPLYFGGALQCAGMAPLHESDTNCKRELRRC